MSKSDNFSTLQVDTTFAFLESFHSKVVDGLLIFSVAPNIFSVQKQNHQHMDILPYFWLLAPGERINRICDGQGAQPYTC